MNYVPHEPIRRILLFCILTTGFALLLSGCNSLFSEKDYLNFSVPTDRLRTIDPQKLSDLSKTEPVTIDEVSAPERFTLPEPIDRIELSIADIRAAALEGNLDLKVDLIGPSIARATVDEEEAKFDSTFKFSGRRQKIDAPQALATESSKATIDSFSTGLDIPLRSGGSFSIDFPFNETTTNNLFSTLNPSVTSDLRFSLSQPLLRNFGEYVNTHTIRVAKQQHQIANARTKLEAIRILANADRAYWRLYAARRELDVRVQQYELAMTQLEQARRKVAAGDSPQIEITRAESGLASRLEAIIITQTLVRRAERNLKVIMNREDLQLNSPTSIFLSTEPEPLGLDLEAERLVQYAIENRMEMLELELQLAIDASTIDFQRNQALPLVTLDYTYNINGLGGTHSQSFDQLDDRSFEDWTVGLNVRIPVGNQQAAARVHRALLQRLQRLATREQRAQAIEQEVYDAIDQLQQNWQRIIAAIKTTQLARLTYEAEQRQFEVGVRTSTDVLDSAASLADAQTREILALTDYQISQVDIAFATGTLMGLDKVQWEPVDVPHETRVETMRRAISLPGSRESRE